jgi:hypothetical protein
MHSRRARWKRHAALNRLVGHELATRRLALAGLAGGDVVCETIVKRTGNSAAAIWSIVT